MGANGTTPRVAPLLRWLPHTIVVTLASLAAAQPFIAQADFWCPYNCRPNSDAPGYVIELLQAAFEPQGTPVRYELVPWNRALANVRDGKATFVIGVSRREAEHNGLLTGNEAVGASRDCLFVGAKSSVRFTQADDLNTLHHVAIVSGYVYDDGFDEWLSRPENKGKTIVEIGENVSELNALNIVRGRIDGAIEDGAVMTMTVHALGLETQVIEAGCDVPTPIYVGVSPGWPRAHQLLDQLDARLAEMRQDKQLGKLLAKYGQQDWK